MSDRITTGSVEPISLFALNAAGNPLTGLTDLYVRVRRVSDGYFLDWTGMTFKASGWTTLNKSATEVSATNAPGLYEVTGGLNTAAITNPAANDDYQVLPIQTPGTNARLPGPGVIAVGKWADTIASAANVADGVWNALRSGHTVAGSFGESVRLNAAGLETDAVNEIRDSILSDATRFQGADIAAILADTNETQTKLPTNNIMGSSVKSDKDDEIDAIKAVTDVVSAKLPTNYLMGSGVQSNKDDEIDAIKAVTDVLGPKLPTDYIMGSAVQSSKDDEIDAILADTNETQLKLPTNNIMGSGVKSDKDDEIDAILADTNETQLKLPTNNIMGSSTKSDKDDEIDTIFGKLPDNNIMGSGVKTNKDDEIDTIFAKLPDNNIMGSGVKSDKDDEIDTIYSKLPTNNIMGSSVKSDKDDEIDTIYNKLPNNNIMGSAVKTDKDDEIDDLHNAVIAAKLTVAAGSTPVQVYTDATAPTGSYNSMLLVVTHAGATVSRRVKNYNVTSGSFTVDAFPFTPSAGDRAWVLDAVVIDVVTITDAFWDEDLTLHTVANSGAVELKSKAEPGDAMDLVAAAVDASALDGTAVAEIAVGVWDEPLAGHTGAGSTGQAQNRLDVAVSTRAAPGAQMDLVNDAVDSASLATSAAVEIAGKVWDEPLAGHAIAGTAGEAEARLDVAVSTRAAPGAQMALTAPTRAAVVDEVWDELTAGHTAAGTTGKALLDAGAVSDPLVIAAAVWDKAAASHTTPGSMGQLENRLDAAITTRAAPGDQMALQANAVDATSVAATGANKIRDTILSDATPFQGARIDAAISSRAAPGAAMDLVANAVDATALDTTGVGKIADGVWDEPIAGHLTAGSTGKALNDGSNPSAIADAVWDEPLAGHTAAGSAGEAEGRLDAAVTTRAAPGDAMDLVTNAVDAAAVSTTGANKIRDSILTDATRFAGANIDAAISSRAAPGDAMDLVTDAVDAAAVAASGAAEIGSAAWDVVAAAHVTPATTGKLLSQVDVPVSTRAAPGAQMALTPATVAGVVDSAWDEPLAGHLAAGTTGKALSDAGAGGNIPAIVAGVWDESRAAHTTPGSMGEAQDLIPVAAAEAQKIDSLPTLDPDLAATGSLLDRLANKNASKTYDQSTDSLEAIRDREDAMMTKLTGMESPTGAVALANADAVWDELLAGHALSGSAGEALSRISSLTHGAWQITLHLEDTSSVPIQGAQIDVYDSADHFLGRVYSDVGGNVNVALDTGTYHLRIFKSGWTFTVPEILTVTADATVTYVGTTLIVIVPPTDPNLCAIYGTVRNAGGKPVANARVVAFAVVPQVIQGTQKHEQETCVVTDGNGFFRMELEKLAEVTFQIEDTGLDVFRTVPNLPSQDLATWT